MNLKLVKGYLLAVLAVVVLAATTVLLVMNQDTWKLHLFIRTVEAPRAIMLLAAMAGGVVVYWTARWIIPWAITSLRAGRKQAHAKASQRRLAELERSRGQAQHKAAPQPPTDA